MDWLRACDRVIQCVDNVDWRDVIGCDRVG